MEFNKAYNRQEFVSFLQNSFLPEDFAPVTEIVTLPTKMKLKYTSEVVKLGASKALDLVVYEIKHTSKHDARVSLSKEAFRLLNEEIEDRALVVFVPEDSNDNYRFSFIEVTLDITEEGGHRISKGYSNPRRYSYYLGKGIACYTPNKYLNDKDRVVDDEDLHSRFSVEVLTKQFYKDLFEWYQWAVDEKTGITFPNNTSIEDDDRENIDVKIIRMITRLMFVWFIKQKELVPNNIFEISYLDHILKNFNPSSSSDGTYYNAILQNLFFATLNRAIVDEDGKKRGFAHVASGKDVKTLYRYKELFNISEEKIINIFSGVPFLNGGLFECLDKTKTFDGVEKAYYYDGFSRNDVRFADGRYKNRAFIPNELFFLEEKGLFSILNRYNFTIEENTPNEQQVALDPELLGKVFENLLGAYNPETKETARNQSGSFYTPREIVNYMVDESLLSYLGKNETTESLFKDDFEKDPSKESEYKNIAIRLRSIKVLDPACGSGAFPMGLLNRLVDLLQKIHTEESTYNLKLAIIENCVYGSDIQSIATQITKLRFFISLICDCEKNSSMPNFGIPTLPNLETKFVAANSLISKKKKAQQGNLFENPEIEPTKKELAETRHEHFLAKSASAKRRLRDKDQELREKLALLLSEDNDFAPEDAKQLAVWNPYDQNAISPFFDPEWMFGVVDGFDIIIGNPPYIQLQNNGGELSALYENCDYKTFARTGDIYCLFYERGWQLLKQGGHLCYITSNKWMRAGYGEKTRDFLASKTNPILLIDFAGVKIFESATVDTNILLFGKGKNNHNTICSVTNKHNKNGIKNLSVFVEQQHSVCDFLNSDSWVILSPIEQSIKRKIEAVGTPLKDWDIQINYGIKTGYNDAFIISTDKRNEILSNCVDEIERKRTEELIRPILRGRDIKRYGYEWANLWLIATFPSRHYDIELYPAVKQYLLSFGIERLEQTGKIYTVDGEKIKARKKTNNKWFETQDSINYWEDFAKPKIVYPNMTKYMPFFLEEDSFLTNQKCFIITGKHVAYLTAFFNSSLFKYCFRENFPELQGGTRELSKIFFDKISVCKITDQQDRTFHYHVEDIQKEYSQEKAIHIDNLIFEMYDLTTQEKKSIGFIEIR